MSWKRYNSIKYNIASVPIYRYQNSFFFKKFLACHNDDTMQISSQRIKLLTRMRRWCHLFSCDDISAVYKTMPNVHKTWMVCIHCIYKMTRTCLGCMRAASTWRPWVSGLVGRFVLFCWTFCSDLA